MREESSRGSLAARRRASAIITQAAAGRASPIFVQLQRARGPSFGKTKMRRHAACLSRVVPAMARRPAAVGELKHAPT